MFYQFSFNVKYTWLEVQKEIVPIWGRHSFNKKILYVQIEKNDLPRSGVAWLEGRGDGRVGYGRDRALLCVTGLEDTIPGPDAAPCEAAVAVGVMGLYLGDAPRSQEQVALLALLLFQSSLPVASLQRRVFFSCLPGQGVKLSRPHCKLGTGALPPVPVRLHHSSQSRLHLFGLSVFGN